MKDSLVWVSSFAVEIAVASVERDGLQVDNVSLMEE